MPDWSESEERIAEWVAQIERGEATAAECLLGQPPAIQDEAGPVLRATERLLAFEIPAMPAQAMANLEKRLLARAQEIRESLQPTTSPHLPAWLLRLAFGTLIILGVLAVTGSAVFASANSLPGTPLYPVKRISEHIQLTFTFSSAKKATLHATFAMRRLQEALMVKAQENRWDRGTLNAVKSELEQATQYIAGSAEVGTQIAWEQIAALTAHGDAELSQIDDRDETVRETHYILKRIHIQALQQLGHAKPDQSDGTGPILPSHQNPSPPTSSPTETLPPTSTVIEKLTPPSPGFLVRPKEDDEHGKDDQHKSEATPTSINEKSEGGGAKEDKTDKIQQKPPEVEQKTTPVITPEVSPAATTGNEQLHEIETEPQGDHRPDQSGGSDERSEGLKSKRDSNEGDRNSSSDGSGAKSERKSVSDSHKKDD